MDFGDGASAKQAWLERFQRNSQRLKEVLGSGNLGNESGAAGELHELESEGRALENQLREMSAEPVAYFLSSSEVARRQTLLRGFQDQLRDLRQVQSGGTFKQENVPVKMRQRQKEIMKLQDEMIQDIGRGVDRLGNQAHKIKDETQLHVRLLDEMDVDVDRATAGLRAEARHAEQIRMKSQNCYLYIIIAVLSAVLLLLIVLGFS